MSQNANDFPIEDLPDVKPHLISKLKSIDSIHELAVSIPNELVWDKGIGDDVQAGVRAGNKSKDVVNRFWLVSQGILHS